jgi:putative molybdopterin biosynthesis protein
VTSIPENIIVCGQDNVLDMLCSATNSKLGKSCFIRSYEGSYNGLLSLYKDEVTVASAHIWDLNSGTYNLPFVSTLIPGEKLHVYHVLNRPVGFYVSKGNPKMIHSVEDFLRPDIKIINREKGSGIRILTDSLLLERNLDSSGINGYDRIVNSHLAAAATVSRGGSDCALGNRNVAMQFTDIDFVELKMEQYDIVIKESSLKRTEIKTMIEILQSREFCEEIDAMGLYDVSDIGKRIL